MDELIAWQGTVEILNAQWSLDSGRTVELRLCGEAYDRVHPFKRFQQRRNGRVGTRFQAAFSRVDSGQEVLAMEVMLAAWKDSSSIGQSITLWLDNEVETHPFCGCNRRKAGSPGDMFALILVELNDDDTPINQERREHVSEPRDAAGVPTGVHDGPAAASAAPAAGAPDGKAPRRDRRDPEGAAARSSTAARPKKFSSSVHLLVTGPLFVRWLRETKGELVKEWTPELARRYAKKVIAVESLSDLDRDQAAVRRFHEHIRRPFERWAHQRP